MTRYVYVGLLSLLFGSLCLSNAEADLMFTTIDVPGSTSTGAFGINAAGQIVGQSFDGTRNHGFLATPQPVPEPDPSTLLLLAIGCVGLLTTYYRRRQQAA